MRRHIIGAYKKLPSSELFNIVTLGCKLSISRVNEYENEIRDFIRRYSIRRDKRFMEDINSDGHYSFGIVKHAQIVTDFDDSIICPSLDE